MTATALQSGMLFHAVAHPGTGVDIEQISITIDEELDVDRFRAAWLAVVERHPILRAHFLWDDRPQPELRFPDEVGVPLVIENWSSMTRTEHELQIQQRMRQDRLTDFDLSVGPLLRLVVAKLASNRWWVLWSFHHSILDGRSFPIVLREIFELYDNGLDHRLSDRTDFRRYVEAMGEQDLTSARTYWTKRLEPFEIPSSINVERPTAAPDDGPSVLPFEISLGLTRTNGLRKLAEREEVTLNTCVQAAWFLLLQHYSRQPVVTFGTTRACRHTVAGAPDMVGLLINTVPMTIRADEHETVGALLRRLRREQLELREHETTPLPVIRQCAPKGTSELFESIVVFDDASLDARMRAAFPAAADSRHFRYDGQTNFPLTLLAYGDPSMLLRLEVATDRYNEATARQLLDQLVNLLDGFVADGGRPASELSYLTDEEHRRFDQWNRTEVDYPLETTLHQLFQTQVERTPDAPALQYGDETLTYRQFNEQVNRLAHQLRHDGVCADTTVGIFAERSFELMIGVYAILKAGGAYVPLDPEHPAERVRFMAEDSGVALVLTQSHLVDSLPAGAFTTLVLDGAGRRWADRPWAGQPVTDPEPVAGPDNLAYLLYTSGSTGRPKGVMIEHRAIVNRLLWMQEAYGLDGSDCVLQKTPYTFDVSVWELFWPMQVGARLVMAEPGGHRDTAYLAATIANYDVTTLHFVPSMLQLFVEEPSVGICSTLRRVICSGEALPRALQDCLFEVLDTELHNLYGPTEAAIDVTWWACDPTSELVTVPIGYPIANTEVHVLDHRLRRVPVGVHGELHLGGVQLARGYHNRQELTAEKFVPDPFASKAGARLYKTGDLVRHRSDGAVEFLGRIDHQVKIRGQRIELGEIEAVIADHPAVREVVVVASGDTAADTRLVAYIVGDGVDEQVLRDHCAVTLAPYMVPTVWLFLEMLPLSANGKVDRGGLPAPEQGTGKREIVDPGSNTEAEIASAWKELLGQNEVGVTETFFDVGGNSLLLIRLAHSLTRHFDHPVSVQQLLRHPTIRQQAQLVDGVGSATDEVVEAGAQQAVARRARRAGRRRRIET